MARASQSIEVDVPPEAFFRVLQEYERYPEFLPEVNAVRVVRGADAVEVTYFLDVTLKVFEFTLRHTARFPRIEWELLRGGDFLRRNSGAWTLERTASGGTRATYAIEMELGPLVPPAMEKALAQRGLPNMLHNFKAHAENVQRGRE